jgi:hypothetical protein
VDVDSLQIMQPEEDSLLRVEDANDQEFLEWLRQGFLADEPEGLSAGKQPAPGAAGDPRMVPSMSFASTGTALAGSASCNAAPAELAELGPPAAEEKQPAAARKARAPSGSSRSRDKSRSQPSQRKLSFRERQRAQVRHPQARARRGLHTRIGHHATAGVTPPLQPQLRAHARPGTPE